MPRLRKAILGLFFLLATLTPLLAQEAPREKQSHLLLNVELGLLIIDDFQVMGQFAVAAGYMVLPSHGLGFEFRTASNNSCGNYYSMHGVGLQYRFLYEGFLARASAGQVLRASRGWDFPDTLEYNDGGYYLSFLGGYAFRGGVYLGLNLTQTSSMDFDYFELDFNTDEPVYSHQTKVDFISVNVTVGYTFPGNRRVQ